MVQIEKSHGLPNVSESLYQAVTKHAERTADLTATFLKSPNVLGDREVRLSANALLELAALLELGTWERQGLLCHLGHLNIPSYQEAVTSFVAQCEKGQAEFEGADSNRLSQTILHVWIEHFAWNGTELLGTECVVGDLDEDEFLNQFAVFVWNNRHELEQLIRGEQNDENT